MCMLCCVLQVVRTTIQPLHGGHGGSYDAYEYVAHSHTYMSDHQPTAKFSYGLSALQVGAADGVRLSLSCTSR